MNPRERERFDALLEQVLADLPASVKDILEEIPVIVEDLPSRKMLDSLAEETGERIPANELCGLHSGVANTELGVDGAPPLPSDIHLFRVGIVEEAGGWEGEGEARDEVEAAIREEIRITLLHELGHQFGLDEDDLEGLGYQ